MVRRLQCYIKLSPCSQSDYNSNDLKHKKLCHCQLHGMVAINDIPVINCYYPVEQYILYPGFVLCRSNGSTTNGVASHLPSWNPAPSLMVQVPLTLLNTPMMWVAFICWCVYMSVCICACRCIGLYVLLQFLFKAHFYVTLMHFYC